MSNQAYISLGGNIGNTQEIFQKALEEIYQHIGKITKKSSLYQTAAWGNTQQNDFINQVICINTLSSAHDLLDSLLTIEIKLDRVREEIWGPRTLDLDILYFNQEIIESPTLIVPHQRIKERKFILIPMNEIASDHVDPLSNQPVAQLLANCIDELAVTKIS